MAEKKALPVFDFKKMKKEDIHTFMVENASPAEKADFKAIAFEDTIQKVMVPDLGADGKQKVVRRKQKDGSYKMVPKMKAVEVKGGEVKKKYSHRKAVNWFYDTYCVGPNKKAEMVNKPEAKEKKDKVSAVDLFADF